MTLRQPDAIVGPFRENNTVRLTATFMDNATPPAVIPGAALVSATVTIYPEVIAGAADPALIVDHESIKATVSAGGVWVYYYTPLIVNTALLTEYHRALVEWVWNVDRKGSYEIQIVVRNVNLVPQ